MSDNVTSMQPMPALHVSPYRQNIFDPRKPLSGFYIPSKGLQLAVQAFLMQHEDPDESPLTPRSMLVQGVPGSGKTEIALRSTLMIGTAIMLIPPSTFSSKTEGGGVEKITEAMQEAERFSHANKLYIAMLFDDIDHSNLSLSENVGRTTNPADVVGHLQSLSTNRNVHVGFSGLPVPLLATANAANKMAPSLWRNQRAKVFTHTLDESTKQELARKYFAPTTHSESTLINSLFRTYRNEEISFWPALHSDYLAKRREHLIELHGFDRAAIRREMAKRPPLDADLLHRLAENCRKSRPFDFLTKLRSSA